ncbi:hypothetical protein CYLTODRAFT_424770 [Cylindrobasidium torrendii FP15055 ss-10]|uniref:Uncharacterized protein n=1 Tax=Cylindrobasidium torrendii FP15055 ss-10 TaxID=1314674 RepID=A0A0D7B3A4_9AGAR|nr:hypothetical protein CYLTODRAFT_424770 [Cylindrobasidium torrendii FP15055 ss-10]
MLIQHPSRASDDTALQVLSLCRELEAFRAFTKYALMESDGKISALQDKLETTASVCDALRRTSDAQRLELSEARAKIRALENNMHAELVKQGDLQALAQLTSSHEESATEAMAEATSLRHGLEASGPLSSTVADLDADSELPREDSEVKTLLHGVLSDRHLLCAGEAVGDPCIGTPFSDLGYISKPLLCPEKGPLSRGTLVLREIPDVREYLGYI